MARKILLADDSVTIQKVVELTFMDEDYEVVAVGNGDEAIAKLGEESPALVIADVHMPGANGYEVCRAAKEHDPALPVLLLVGTFEPFQEDDARAAGADQHLKKPFDSQELLRRVEELLSATPTATMSAAELPDPQPETEIEEIESIDLDAVEEIEPMGGADEGGFELERSPWDDAEEAEPVEVHRAEGLQNVETMGAGSDLPEGSRPAEGIVHGSALEADDVDPDQTWAEPVASSRSEAEASTPPRAVASEAPPDSSGLSEEDVERIARRVAELLSDGMLRDIAWEVVPDLAEVVIKDRIRELERQVE